nr:pirin family protein [Corynebacterium lactis]
MSIKDVRDFQVIRSDQRSIWRAADVTSRQAFPATGNFVLEDNAFGHLAVHNDDIVSPGEGFDMHQHDNMEIFTWVVDGRIAHRDSTLHPGEETIITRGTATYINAGRGIRHAEVNADDFTSRSFLRVVQMWILPDQRDTDPSYTTADVSAMMDRGGMFLLAAPRGSGAPLETVSASARLYTGVLADGSSDSIALDEFTHVYVVRGRIEAQAKEGTDTSGDSEMGRAELGEGDQLRITAGMTAGGADGALELRALEPDTEVLVWTMKG